MPGTCVIPHFHGILTDKSIYSIILMIKGLILISMTYIRTVTTSYKRFLCSFLRPTQLIRHNPQMTELRGAHILSRCICHNHGQSKFIYRELDGRGAKTVKQDRIDEIEVISGMLKLFWRFPGAQPEHSDGLLHRKLPIRS